MAKILSEKISSNSSFFIASDFNIEMKHDNNVKFRLFTLLNHFSIRAQIHENTRIIEHSKSCIDDISTNLTSNLISNVLEYPKPKFVASLSTSKIKENSFEKEFSMRKMRQISSEIYVGDIS